MGNAPRAASRLAQAISLAAALAVLVCATAPAALARRTVCRAGPEVGFAAASRGPRTASWNPALLALAPERRLDLFTFRGELSNNSYSVGEYVKRNGAFWDEHDKAAILEQVSAAGVTLEGDARLSAFGLSLGSLAISCETRGASTLTLPKDALEILFYGNSVGETFDLSGAEGVGMVFTEWRLSGARPVGALFPSAPRPLAGWTVGATVKLFEGWAYGRVVEAGGDVTTTAEYVYGGGRLRSVFARGGHGFGLDLGLAGNLGDRWTLSIAVRDLWTVLDWTADAEERIDVCEVPGLSLGDGRHAGVSSESVARPLDSIRTPLPPVFSWGAVHRGERLLAAALLEVTGQRHLGASRRTCLSLAGAYPAWDHLVVRGVADLGGCGGGGLGAGVGLAVGPIQVDLGLHTRGSPNPFSGKGLGLTTGVGILL
jgi:hypothetical protein